MFRNCGIKDCQWTDFIKVTKLKNAKYWFWLENAELKNANHRYLDFFILSAVFKMK